MCNRIPLDHTDLELFTDGAFTRDQCRRLLSFYERYQESNWIFFLNLRERWHRENPDITFPGLCANVHPLTGEFRPQEEQLLWGWGDGRALGIWPEYLVHNRVPEKQIRLHVDLDTIVEVDLKSSLEEYCRTISDGLIARQEKNGRFIPFVADYRTNLGVGKDGSQQTTPGISEIFAVNGFVQHALQFSDRGALHVGLEMLREVVDAIEMDTFYLGPGGPGPAVGVHGPRMLMLGAFGEILKTLDCTEAGKLDFDNRIRDDLVSCALPFIDYILGNHYRDSPPAFWEYSDRRGAAPRHRMLVG